MRHTMVIPTAARALGHAALYPLAVAGTPSHLAALCALAGRRLEEAHTRVGEGRALLRQLDRSRCAQEQPSPGDAAGALQAPAPAQPSVAPYVAPILSPQIALALRARTPDARFVRNAAGRISLAAETAERILVEAGATLASTLDYDATLQDVARLAVPALADWCTVDLAEASGAIRRVALAAAEPAKEALLREITTRFPPSWDDPHPAGIAMRTGRTELLCPVTPAYLEYLATSPEHLALLRRLGTRSRMSVPLAARGQVLGAISFFSATRGYSARDVALAEELARRAALAIDNARLYAAEHTSRAAAEAALAVRDRFLSASTHDLGQPLAAIRLAAQLLRRQVTQVDGDTAAPELDEIDAAVAQTAALIGELMDLARLQAGHELDLHRAPTDLVELLRRAVDAQQKRTRAHTLCLETAESTLVGEWDGARLTRVIGNLLDNAVTYSPDGGRITVTVARAGGDGTSDATAVVRVTDQGIGIPEAELERVTRPFYRASNAAGRMRGSGIGLTGARHIVEQHGGALRVDSREGAGTTVTVTLPMD
jgi:signal transduction histidine kinase